MSLFSFALPSWIAALKYIDLGVLCVFVLFFLAIFAFRAVFPKIGAVAWVTAKEALYQPLYLILTLIGLFALFIFLLIPYNTLGEDIKLVITQGSMLIKLICVFLAVWKASTTIADEIEGKTALMALSKPISRLKFVVGKYAGVMIAVTIIFLILGAFFLNTVSYKVVYDAREASKETPGALECALEVYKVLPVLILHYFETLILAAIAIAISTRLALLPNLSITLMIFLLGHLTPVVVQSSAGQLPMVGFVANLISVLAPCLDHFSMESVIAMSIDLSEKNVTMFGWSALFYVWYFIGICAYTLCYCTATLLLALLLFENRDLA